MPQFERPLKISSMDQYPSIGSLWVEVGVIEFINACSDEEFDQLVDEIRKIDAQNAIAIPPPQGLKPLTKEELDSMFPNRIEYDKLNGESKEIQMPKRRNVKRTNKKNKDDEQE